MFKNKWFLPQILIAIGVFLRVLLFGQIPTDLNRDEAALGYNAFSLATYQQDEWGVRWPLIFKSFGDYKLPGYIYLDTVLVKIFGTAQWVIRLPSLLASLGLLWVGFRFVRKLFSESGAWWATATLAVSPWAIFYGRMAYEANVALFFLLLALLFLIKPLTLRNGLALFSFYLLSVLTYNTPLLLAPVLMFASFLLPKEPFRHKFLKSMVFGLVALILGIALLPVNQQKQGITIFNDPTIQAQYRENYAQSQTIFEKLIHHRLSVYAQLSTAAWVKTFLPEFLVFRGGSHPWHSLPGKGHFGLSLYILSLLGAGLLIRRRSKPFLLWLLVLGTLPALVTVDAPHATRSLLVLLLLSLLAGTAVTAVSKKLQIPLVLALIIETGIFTYRYFIWFPHSMSPSWPQGVIAAIQEAEQKTPVSEQIVFKTTGEVTTNPMNEQVYIYYLLNAHLSPQAYLDSALLLPPDASGMIQVQSIGRFVFDKDAQVEGNPGIIRLDKSGKYVFEN